MLCLVYLGILGHTHNGGDRDHNIHNNCLSRYISVTLAAWIRHYPRAWHTGVKPTAAILNVQYDWDAYYKLAKNKFKGMNERISQ